jgi:hypothetical protein
MDTPAFETEMTLSGPLRAPKQLLADQQYDGHLSIHDAATAEAVGFSDAPIEGPTHFSQFVPLLHHIWGNAWFERGCLSAHFKNMVFDGEEVRAFVNLPRDGERQVNAWAEKADGTPVLTGTASIGPDFPESELEQRMEKLRPPENLVILQDMNVGDKGAEREEVVMEYDQHLGDLYPFTLNEKLAVITEDTRWHRGRSPWVRPIIPLEMVCVLCQYTSKQAGWKVRQPCLGLFADLEIRMLKGPLFVGQPYVLEREIVALSESRRTEGYWVRTIVREADSEEPVASILLQHAVMKASYPEYAAG